MPNYWSPNWDFVFHNNDITPAPGMSDYFAVYGYEPAQSSFQNRAISWSGSAPPGTTECSTGIARDFSPWTDFLINLYNDEYFMQNHTINNNLAIYIQFDGSADDLPAALASIFGVPLDIIQQQFTHANVTPKDLLTYLTLNADYAAQAVGMELNATSGLDAITWYAKYMGLTGPWAFASSDHYIRQVWSPNPMNYDVGWSITRGDPANFEADGPDYVANGIWINNGALHYLWDRYLVPLGQGASTLWLQYPFVISPDNVSNVQSNLVAMNAFVKDVTNQVDNYATDVVWQSINSGTGGYNASLAKCLEIFSIAFEGLSVFAGDVGGLAATLLCDTLMSYQNNPPSGVSSIIADISLQITNTSTALQTLLVNTANGLRTDATQSWTYSFTFNGQTMQVSDLAMGVFPTSTGYNDLNDVYSTMVNNSVYQTKQAIWTTVLLANFQINAWLPTYDSVTGGDNYFYANANNSDMITTYAAFLAGKSPFYPPQGYPRHPAYYWTWVPSSDTYSNGMEVSSFNLGTPPPGSGNDGSISDEACQNLFIDGVDGVVLNPGGMFTREFVFTELGLRQSSYSSDAGASDAAASTDPTGDFLRARQNERSRGVPPPQTRRAAVDRRIREEAWKNPAFADALRAAPKQALERFLGIKIAAPVSIHVVMEDDSNYGVVIPKKPS